MSYRKERNRLLGQRVVAAMKNRQMDAYFVETVQEAKESILKALRAKNKGGKK